MHHLQNGLRRYHPNLRVPGRSLLEELAPTPVFRAADDFDFRLVADSPAVDAGVEMGTVAGVDLRPRLEYVHPASVRPRPLKGPLDMGAFEYE